MLKTTLLALTTAGITKGKILLLEPLRDSADIPTGGYRFTLVGDQGEDSLDLSEGDGRVNVTRQGRPLLPTGDPFDVEDLVEWFLDDEAYRGYGRVEIRGGEDLVQWVLTDWLNLASRGAPVDMPLDLTVETIQCWAEAVLASASKEEPDMAPVAHIRLESGGVTLQWEGTFTHRRMVDFWLRPSEDGWLVEIEWQTGTGDPSRYLRECRYLVPPFGTLVVQDTPKVDFWDLALVPGMGVVDRVLVEYPADHPLRKEVADFFERFSESDVPSVTDQ